MVSTMKIAIIYKDNIHIMSDWLNVMHPPEYACGMRKIEQDIAKTICINRKTLRANLAQLIAEGYTLIGLGKFSIHTMVMLYLSGGKCMYDRCMQMPNPEYHYTRRNVRNNKTDCLQIKKYKR